MLDRYVIVIDDKIVSTVMWDPEAFPNYPEQIEGSLMPEITALEQGIGYSDSPDDFITPTPDLPSEVEIARTAILGARTIAGLRTAVVQYLDASGGM